MSAETATYAVSWVSEQSTGTRALQQEQQLNRFLAEVERRALRIAEIGVRDRDDALDLVQDAMIKLAQKYADRSSAEWAPLFYRILQNGVRDWHRRQAVRNRVMVWFGRGATGEDEYDVVAAAPDPIGRSPDEELQNSEATAVAMGCSQGSVKTHYSRAIHSLRETLGEHGPAGSGDG
jgi:RNA polymerase sigma-70 factor (ECF subfamily)